MVDFSKLIEFILFMTQGKVDKVKMNVVTEKIAPTPIVEAAALNRHSLIELEVGDATSKQLLVIASRHCKLVLEHGKAVTLIDRRQEIMEEI